MQISSLFAYFDPSAGSLIVQAAAGGLGGIIVVLRYFWKQYFGHRRNQCTSIRSADPKESQVPATNPSMRSPF
jgi:hypothetical protein